MASRTRERKKIRAAMEIPAIAPAERLVQTNGLCQLVTLLEVKGKIRTHDLPPGLLQESLPSVNVARLVMVEVAITVPVEIGRIMVATC